MNEIEVLTFFRNPYSFLHKKKYPFSEYELKYLYKYIKVKFSKNSNFTVKKFYSFSETHDLFILHTIRALEIFYAFYSIQINQITTFEEYLKKIKKNTDRLKIQKNYKIELKDNVNFKDLFISLRALKEHLEITDEEFIRKISYLIELKLTQKTSLQYYYKYSKGN